jgi:metal-responsive CopG/Arc/MetJ family transcriptional regulator
MTVQIDIDEKLVVEIDEAIKVLKENREDVFREAFLELARKKKREAEVVRMYAEAYKKNPQTAEEIEEWEEVQYWEDE